MYTYINIPHDRANDKADANCGFTDLPFYWLTDLGLYWLTDALIYWFTDLLIYWFTDLRIYGFTDDEQFSLESVVSSCSGG